MPASMTSEEHRSPLPQRKEPAKPHPQQQLNQLLLRMVREGDQHREDAGRPAAPRTVQEMTARLDAA